MCKKVTDDEKTRPACNLFRRGASNGITMQTEEQELIRRIAGGETELCARLTDRYGKAVYTLAARIAGCTEDAEELTQDIFSQGVLQAGPVRRAEQFFDVALPHRLQHGRIARAAHASEVLRHG